MAALKLKLSIITLILAVLTGGATEAATQSWCRLMLAGKKASDLPSFLAAIKVAEQFGEDDPRLHLALRAAADRCRYLAGEKLQLAETLLRRDIAFLEKIDVNFPDIVSDCFELARVFEMEGRYTEAEAQLKRALSIRNRWRELQSGDPFQAEVLAELYIVQTARGENNLAEQTYVEMNHAVAQVHTKPARGFCLHSMQVLLHEYVGRHKQLAPQKARRMLEIALAISREATPNFIKNLDIANELRDSAVFERELNEPGKAEELVTQSLKLIEDDFPSEADVVWWNVECLSQILIAQHRYQEIERWQAWYLSKWAGASGTSSVEYAQALDRCAVFWQRYGCFDRAKKLSDQSRSIMARLKGPQTSLRQKT